MENLSDITPLLQSGGWLVIPIIFAILFLWWGFFTVQQQTAAVVERFGRFVRVAPPGLRWRMPMIDKIAGRISLRVQQLDVNVETKTEDNVFVHVAVSVQYVVPQEKVYDAFYRLNDTERQITAFVFDVVRARVPRIKLDDVFSKKEEIAEAVKEQLGDIMDDFGYQILRAPVTDIDPDAKVKAAMNRINEAQRLRVAAEEEGEAARIIQVKRAEGEKATSRLHGEGLAEQRLAIAQGLHKSADLFKDVDGIGNADVMNLLFLIQYMDMLGQVGTSEGTHTLMLPHSPSAVGDFSNQIRDAMLVASRASVENAPEAEPTRAPETGS